MECPTKLKFGGQQYKIRFVKGLKQKGKELLGLCVYTKNEILLDPDQGRDSLKSTLLHESLHAGAEAIDWEAQEETIKKIEKVVYALIRENPSLVRWLLAKEKPSAAGETK